MSSTSISVQIGKDPVEYRDIEEYCIDSSILTLMDAFTFKIPDPGGRRSLGFKEGDLVSIYMSDPRVAGGQSVQMLTGRLIEIERTTDERGGCTLDVTGGDLGWHLVNSCGPLFKSTMSITFKKFAELIIDPSWGFAKDEKGSSLATDNEFNRRLQQGLKLNQGRASFAASRAPVDTFIPPVCFEAGEVISDKLITYARRARRLVNISADGFLQIFKPNYTQAAAFTLDFHRLDEATRRKNNVKSPVRITQTIEGLYTHVICVGTEVLRSVVSAGPYDPHEGTFQAKITDNTVLPFKRVLHFSDSDSLDRRMANDRVLQRFQRGQFDSWTATYTVDDHVLGGTFVTPDSMCAIDDTVNSVRGNYYVAGRQFRRSIGNGTTTTIQVRKPNLLRA